MIRLVIDALLIFLIPFAVWWGIQSWRLKDPKAAMKMEKGPFIVLTLIGLVLCIGVIIAGEVMAPHGEGGYERARWENGRLIGGRVKP